MPRSLHGRVDATPETLREGREAIEERIAEVEAAFALFKRVEFERRFDFLLPELQDDPDNLLPVALETRKNLVRLGEAMADDGTDDPAGDAEISAAFTYFGQFVDHDITLERSAQPGMAPPVEEDLEPLPLEDIREQTRNVRTGVLELDSVYNSPAKRDPEPDGLKMKIGEVQPVGNPVPDKDAFNDFPRRPPNENPKRDREALIGDPRNDENLIIAQLHVAFLRAHNKLVEATAPPNRFKKAKRRLRRHYQYIVLHDFLKQIADPVIVDDTIERNRVYDPHEDEFFMPLEFSVAAYRFGHSMVRAEYDYNLNFNRNNPPKPPPPEEPTNRATLDRLFFFTALSGELAGLPTLPQNWIIEWENFFKGTGGQFFNQARRIDTQIVEPLERLKTMTGQLEGDPPDHLAAKLAVRNLLRGYQLRMPTGQAVARALGERLKRVREIPELTPPLLIRAAMNERQVQVLEDAGFLERTPLWYYILAEAFVFGSEGRLGPVGSTIVAEVLVGLVRRSPDSILAPGSTWKPNLPSPQQGRTLEDLLRFAGLLRSP